MGDFNGDGHLDWAVSNGADSTIWIYLGKGDGTSNPPTIIQLTGFGPTWLTAVSLRANGMQDLVVAEADSGAIGVLLGNGDGTFQPEVDYPAPNIPLFVLSGDFNGDGKLDIAVGMIGSTATGPVAVLPGDGQGHLGAALYAASDLPSTGSWLASADLNGDGKPDLVVIDPDDVGPHGGAEVYLNNGNGTFTAGQLFFANYGAPGVPSEESLSAALGDVNGDGCPDVVVTEAYGLALVFTGNCAGTFNVPTFSQAPIGDIGGAIQLVDVNKDGKLDIVTSGIVLSGAGGPGLGDVAGNLVSVLLGDGTGHFAPGIVYRGEPSMYGLAMGDLNGDGFPDLVTANQDSNTASVFLNDGKGGFGDPQGEPIGYSSGGTNSPETQFLFADVDGNGTKDLVLLETPPRTPGSVEITTMLNDGTGKFSPPIQSPAWSDQYYPGDFVLADFRNTGKPDLLVISMFPSSLYFAPNIGGGKFGPSTLVNAPGASSILAVGDFDGDGKLDFVAVSGNDLTGLTSQQVNVFLGNGDGTFRPGQSISFGGANSSINALAVYVGDFNQDGKLDILALTDGLYEFFGNGDGTFQPARQLFPTFGAFALADMNRDGRPDLIAMTDPLGNPTFIPTIPTISVFLGQADGSFQYAQTYTPYLDILRWPILYGAATQGSSFEALLGDFNGDGNPDVAMFQLPSQQQSNSFVQTLFGNGDGTFTPDYIASALNKSYVPQFAADVNGDGLTDLIELDNYTASFNVVKSILSSPALQVEMLTNPVAGNTGYGRVVLALATGTATTVAMTASDPNIGVPATVVIPAGSVSQDFEFSVGNNFNPRNIFTIQAQVGTSTATGYGYVSNLPVPVIELEPTGLLFGDVNVGSAITPQSVTLKNLGSAPLTPSIGGAFTETNDCGSTVLPGGSCTIQQTFEAPYPGLTSGALNVEDTNYGISSQVNFDGFGLGLQIAPCCLSFASNLGTTTPPQTITLTNQQTIPVQITSQLNPGGQGFAEVNNCGALGAGATCQFTVTYDPSSDASGSDTIQITESPGTGYQIELTGTTSDFALNTTASSATVTAGQAATYQFTATSMGGFVGAVSLSCEGAPQGATCSGAPNPANLTSGQASNFTVTVTTTAHSMSSLAPAIRINDPAGRSISWVFLSTLIFAGIVWGSQRRKRTPTIVAVLLAIVMCSCGGGGSGGNGSGGGGGGNGGGGGSSSTPTGTYTLTVTGTAGALSHSFQVSLTVQ